MLTRAILQANEALSALTDEQINAIETLSRNDENQVIGTRLGELHGQYDQDVLSVTGIAKNQGEKSYDYVKRVLGSYKEKTSSIPALNNTISELTGKVSELETQIKDGNGNEAIAKQLKDAQKKLADMVHLNEVQLKEANDKYERLNEEYRNSRITAVFDNALGKMQFKTSYPQSIIDVLIGNAKSTILSECKAEFNEDGKLIFRGADDAVLLNKSNALNPYTAGELLAEKLKDIIDEGVHAEGAGTKPQISGAGTIADIANCKTKVEADEAIFKTLMSEGLTRGSNEFQERFTALRNEYKVGQLPTN